MFKCDKCGKEFDMVNWTKHECKTEVSESAVTGGSIAKYSRQHNIDLLINLARTVVRRREHGGDLNDPIQTMGTVLRRLDAE